MTSDFNQVIEQDHRALNALVTGDPEPKKSLFSRRDDVTLANPLGPPARGWHQVEKTLERAVSQLREGEPIRFERISQYATADLAYTLEFERWRGKIGGSDQIVPMALRATTMYRREDGEWKIVHRHADPIIAPRPPESILEQ
ncbi:MAG: nuclear transport factor 2 family protein [Actinomycetota bacterium]|nr:nuclear transport factor 2 family protein [Actinomycetota bacterium]